MRKIIDTPSSTHCRERLLILQQKNHNVEQAKQSLRKMILLEGDA